MTPTPGTLVFDTVPRLPDGWETGSDADTVWTVWDKNTLYLWGANAANQFVARGQALNGGGMASLKGPTRGLWHPQYVGIDTMALSPTENPKVFDTVGDHLKGGGHVVVPVYMSSGDPDDGKYSLGTGYGLSVDDCVKIHATVWGQILALAALASSVSVPASMWTPDVLQPDYATRLANRVNLPDLAAAAAWQAKLAAA